MKWNYLCIWEECMFLIENVVSDRTLSFSDWWFDQMSCPGKKNIVTCCWVPGTQCESRKPSTEPRLTGWWFGTCFIFPSYWESHHPNWRTRSFFRGVGLNHQPVGFGMDFHATSWDNVPGHPHPYGSKSKTSKKKRRSVLLFCVIPIPNNGGYQSLMGG